MKNYRRCEARTEFLLKILNSELNITVIGTDTALGKN